MEGSISMKLLIEIKNEEQARKFLVWAAYRDPDPTGDLVDINFHARNTNGEIKTEHLYIDDITVLQVEDDETT